MQVEPIPVNTLVNRCICGERAAQKELYDKYKTAMFTIARRILGDDDQACDVLQDAFVDVFRHLHKFRGESTVGAWIKTIVIRHALKKNKSEFRFIPFEQDEHDGSTEQYQKILSAEIDKAIAALPAGYRSVFTLVEVEGYSHKETAIMLGISENTSRSQLYHAKKQLQQLLKELKP